jgi:hypothetical protein
MMLLVALKESCDGAFFRRATNKAQLRIEDRTGNFVSQFAPEIFTKEPTFSDGVRIKRVSAPRQSCTFNHVIAEKSPNSPTERQCGEVRELITWKSNIETVVTRNTYD